MWLQFHSWLHSESCLAKVRKLTKVYRYLTFIICARVTLVIQNFNNRNYNQNIYIFYIKWEPYRTCESNLVQLSFTSVTFTYQTMFLSRLGNFKLLINVYLRVSWRTNVFSPNKLHTIPKIILPRNIKYCCSGWTKKYDIQRSYDIPLDYTKSNL